MKSHEDPFSGLHIVNSTPQDMSIIFELFNKAIDYQKKNGFELWPQFSEQLIQTEVLEKRHWKILDGNKTACVFSVLHNDPVIWGHERDQEPSVYLHRIAINPLFKGKGMMKLIRQWAMEYGKQNNRKYVRMNTWGNNERLRNYYIDCGFNYIGQQYLQGTEGLPGHYGGSVLSLFQIDICV